MKKLTIISTTFLLVSAIECNLIAGGEEYFEHEHHKKGLKHGRKESLKKCIEKATKCANACNEARNHAIACKPLQSQENQKSYSSCSTICKKTAAACNACAEICQKSITNKSMKQLNTCIQSLKKCIASCKESVAPCSTCSALCADNGCDKGSEIMESCIESCKKCIKYCKRAKSKMRDKMRREDERRYCTECISEIPVDSSEKLTEPQE